MHKDRIWYLVSKKIAGEATADELVELQELLRQHPEMHYAIQHIHDLWELDPQLAPESGEAFQKHLARMLDKGIDISSFRPTSTSQSQQSFHNNKRSFTRRFALAGLVFAVITAGMVIGLNLGKKSSGNEVARNISEISTKNGSRSKINLPDGSSVWLNSGSKLTYNKNFGVQNRQVTLTGEAYFDVVKMEELPFVIHTPSIQVKVLGTAFNVKSYPFEQASETSVIRGSVEVMPLQRPDEKYVLLPNEKLIVANAVKEGKVEGQPANPLILRGPLTYYRADSVIVETCWTDNRLVFDNESFADIARKMERWYGVTIEFRDPELEKMRLTGSFVSETIYEALNALQISGGFGYEVVQNTVFIMK